MSANQLNKYRNINFKIHLLQLMKTSSNAKASGILFTLSFIGLFFVTLIVVLVADIEIGAFFEDQVNGAINSEVQSRVSNAATTAKSTGNISNSLFYELGNFE